MVRQRWDLGNASANWTRKRPRMTSAKYRHWFALQWSFSRITLESSGGTRLSNMARFFSRSHRDAALQEIDPPPAHQLSKLDPACAKYLWHAFTALFDYRPCLNTFLCQETIDALGDPSGPWYPLMVLAFVDKSLDDENFLRRGWPSVFPFWVEPRPPQRVAGDAHAISGEKDNNRIVDEEEKHLWDQYAFAAPEYDIALNRRMQLSGDELIITRAALLRQSGEHNPLFCTIPGFRQTRVLRVFPSLAADSPLYCRLYPDYRHWGDESKKKENATPLHHALSYCWGDEDDTRTVFVNGIKIEITRNLYEFLKMARQSLSTEYQHVLLFWVDAICINQRDADEKARQILQMPSIYRRSLTLLWMGESSKGVDSCVGKMEEAAIMTQEVRALQTVERFVQKDGLTQGKESIRVHIGENYKPGLDSADDILIKWCGSDTTPEQIRVRKEALLSSLCSNAQAYNDAYKTFFGNSYWSRRWIVQEFMLGKSPQVFCRSGCFDLESVLYNLREYKSLYIDIVDHALCSNLTPPDWLDLDRGLGRITALLEEFHKALRPLWFNQDSSYESSSSESEGISSDSRSSKSENWKPTLLDLLETLRESMCKDPKDIIFAVLSLAQDRTDFADPDYHISTHALFTDVATRMMRRYHSLNVIENAGIPNTVAKDLYEALPAGWPSWLPTWDGRYFPTIPRRKGVLRDASKNRQALFSIFADVRVLEVTGLICDSVSASNRKVLPAHRGLGWRDAIKVAQNAKRTDGRTAISSLLDALGSCMGMNTQPSNDKTKVTLDVIGQLAGLMLLGDNLRTVAAEQKILCMFPGIIVPDFVISALFCIIALEELNSTGQAPHDSDASAGLILVQQWSREMNLEDCYNRILELVLGQPLSLEDLDLTNDILSRIGRRAFSGTMPSKHHHLLRTRKVIFVTQRGRLCVAPDTVQSGDLVIILYGSGVPLLLRQTGPTNNYIVVGDCFVDGLMHGEALEDLSAIEKKFKLV